MKLEGKVVLVTGASKGIGAAAAAELARRGARVVLAARDAAALERGAAAIRAAGGQARAVAMDVTDDASVGAAVAAVLAAEGRVDCVVNNAGIGGALATWWDEPGKLREMIELHVFGMERVTRAVLPSMLARREGTVVNVVSALAWAPMVGAASYSAAKAAVLSLSEALREELRGTGVQLNIFAPGHTRTDSAWPLATGQILTPDQVARDLARSIERRRRTFVSGLSNRNLVWLKRFLPSLAMKIITAIGWKAMRDVKALPAPR